MKRCPSTPRSHGASECGMKGLHRSFLMHPILFFSITTGWSTGETPLYIKEFALNFLSQSSTHGPTPRMAKAVSYQLSQPTFETCDFLKVFCSCTPRRPEYLQEINCPPLAPFPRELLKNDPSPHQSRELVNLSPQRT